MKRILCLGVFLALLLSACGFPAEKRETDGLLPWPDEPVKLYVSADLHWQDPAWPSQIPWLEEILHTLMAQTVQDSPGALILCGDLTNDGTLEEHQAVAALLEEAQAAGVRVFVTMGNHDMERGLPPETLEELYEPFGWEQTLSRDESTMSYLAPLTDELWLLSLDCNVYGERESELAGLMEGETLAWVEDCLERARTEGAMVVPFSHHNLLVHNLTGEGRSYNIQGGEALLDLFLSYGVPIHLSGHRHNSFLTEAGQGERKLTEAVVGLPSSWPQSYTSLTFQKNGTVDYALKFLDVACWAEAAGRTEPELLDFSAWSEERERERLAGIADLAVGRMEVPEGQRNEMKRYFQDFYTCYQSHELWREAPRLLKDPGLSLWKAHTGENIYTRWMPWILENQTNDAPEQTLGPFR